MIKLKYELYRNEFEIFLRILSMKALKTILLANNMVNIT